MKKHSSDEQIITSLREGKAGVSARGLCRKQAVSNAMLNTWLKNYGGKEVTEVKRLKLFGEENSRLQMWHDIIMRHWHCVSNNGVSQMQLQSTVIKPRFVESI